MTDENTAVYYQRRQERERHLAAAAISPSIAAIHREMADRYRELATGLAPAPRN